MVNKALRIVLYSIFTISLLFVVPFNTIHADDYTGSTVVGFNTVYKETTVINGANQYNYVEEFILDDSYVGYLNVSFVVNYYDQNGNSASYTFYGGNRYVNGSKFEVPFFITGSNYYTAERPAINNVVVTYGNHNLVKHSALNDLDQIISLLTDLYNNTDGIEGLESSQLTALQNIVSNTSLANTYLESISKMRQWIFQDESLYPNLFMFYQGYEISDLFTYNYWKYPMFKVPTNGLIARPYLGLNEYFYMITIGYSFNNLNAVSVLLDTELVPISVKTIQTINMPSNDLRINLVQFQNQTSQGYKTISNKYQNNIIFIYYGTSNINGVLNVSTDFALQYGLNNRLLDNLNIIANGTTASSSAAQSSDSANSQLQQDSNTLFTQEDSFKQNMQQSMNNIDTTFSLNNFGSSFMTSAQWVRTQYETLTNNTPFASLITFSLLVGLALIVIGKVYK